MAAAKEVLRILLALCAIALVTGPSIAEAHPVQEFDYSIRKQTARGAFTVVFSYRSYDTSGVPLPPVTSAYLRMPAGLKIRREFLTKRFACDLQRLEETKNPRSCRNAAIGKGRLLLDARPYVEENVPTAIHLFLARSRDPKAVASVAMLALPDQSAPVVKDSPFLQESKVVLLANLYHEPSPLFSYKLELPTGPIRGLNYTIAEAQLRIAGLSLTRRTRRCVARRRARCARSKKVYWFLLPRCPRSRKFGFQSFLAYAGIPSVTIRTSVPCPRFTRR